MILNRPEDEPVAPTGRIGQALGGISILYLIGRLAMILMNVALPNKAIALASPAPIMLTGWGSAGPEAVGWGTVKAVGNDLFGAGLFPFEAISILLLVAVVGAIAIARPLHPDDGTDADPGIHP
jgi:NADH-quinone oxidoreductase subunit J